MFEFGVYARRSDRCELNSRMDERNRWITSNCWESTKHSFAYSRNLLLDLTSVDSGHGWRDCTASGSFISNFKAKKNNLVDYRDRRSNEYNPVTDNLLRVTVDNIVRALHRASQVIRPMKASNFRGSACTQQMILRRIKTNSWTSQVPAAFLARFRRALFTILRLWKDMLNMQATLKMFFKQHLVCSSIMVLIFRRILPCDQYNLCR